MFAIAYETEAPLISSQHSLNKNKQTNKAPLSISDVTEYLK